LSKQVIGDYVALSTEDLLAVVTRIEPGVRILGHADEHRGFAQRLAEIDGIVDDGEHRDDIAVTDEVFLHVGGIALRNAVGFDPAAFEVSRLDGQRVALIGTGGETGEGVRRVRRRVRAAIHIHSPIALRDLAIEAPRDEPLGERVTFLPNPVVGRRIPEVRRDVAHALVLPDRLARGRPRQRVQPCGVVQRNAAVVGKITSRRLRLQHQLVGTP
jgi:hypothetical protein